MAHVLSETTVESTSPSEERIALQCPSCQALLGLLSLGKSSDANQYSCVKCQYTVRCQNGIWLTLAPNRLAYFSRFIEDYQKIRTAEGRGSLQPEFYLNLPDKDLSGNNVWQW